MNTIWKQRLEVETEQTIEIPEGSKLLTVGEQNGIMYIWFSCNTENPKRDRTIFIIGTGDDLPYYDVSYIGTIFQYSGRLVFHVYEKC